MSQANQERYKKALEDLNASLPVETTDGERERLLMEALNKMVEQDVQSLIGQAATAFDTEYDKLTQMENEEQMVAARQALAV